MKSNVQIFFSYAWGDDKEQGESRENIVNELYISLVEDGYTVVRDKMNLGYKGLISEFMRSIGRGNYIVLVIGDKYLKSPNCMFELLEIYRKSNSEIDTMQEKLFPLILGDAKIYDPEDRLYYVKYWKSKKDELDKKINEIGLEYAAVEVDDFKLYKEITSNIGILSKLLKDMNTLNPKTLSKENFTEIKKAIETRGSIFQTESKGNSNAENSSNQEALYKLAHIRKFLERALNDSEFNAICMDHFEDVYNQFTDGQSKAQKINLLLGFCKRNLTFQMLLDVMEESNKVQFELNKPYV